MRQEDDYLSHVAEKRKVKFKYSTNSQLLQKQSKVRGLHRLLNVGISQDDCRRLAAELQGYALDVVRRRLLDDLPHLGGPGEGDLVHVRVVGDGGPGSGTVAGHDVEHTRGEARLPAQLGNVEPRERSLLSQLHHHRVAHRQGRAQLPGLHEKGKVPGNDLEMLLNVFLASTGYKATAESNST